MSSIFNRYSPWLLHTHGLAIAVGIAYLMRIPSRAIDGSLTAQATFSLTANFILLAVAATVSLFALKYDKKTMFYYCSFLQILGWLQVVVLLIINLFKGLEWQPLVASHGVIWYVAVLVILEICRGVYQKMYPEKAVSARLSPPLEHLLDITKEEIISKKEASGAERLHGALGTEKR